MYEGGSPEQLRNVWLAGPMKFGVLGPNKEASTACVSPIEPWRNPFE